jgi:hypothetical protein
VANYREPSNSQLARVHANAWQSLQKFLDIPEKAEPLALIVLQTEDEIKRRTALMPALVKKVRS